MSLPRAARAELAALRETAERALRSARMCGAEHAEVRAEHGLTLSAQVRDGALGLLSEAQSRGLSARVVVRDRVGTATSSDLRPEGVDRMIAEACTLAALAEEDPLAEPPAPALLARSWPELDLYDPAVRGLGADRAIQLARVAEAAALAADPRIHGSGGAVCSRAATHSVLATSGGFVGASASTWAGLRAHAVASGRAGHYWCGGRHFAQVEPPEAVGREAARRALRMLDAHPVATGTYPVVFAPEAAATLVGLFASCLLGDAVVRRRSYLALRLGTRVAGPGVGLVDDPHVLRGPGSRGFDGEGLPTRRVVAVRRGVLESFLLDSRSARRLDLKPTAAAAGGGGLPHASVSNCFMLPGRAAPASLIAGVRRGLYVRTLLGFGFDPGTGNLSRGAEGHFIADGELTHPVAEVTVSRDLDALMQGIEAVASDLELRAQVSAPSFRVDWATVAGT